jgi:hypothetical protein
MTFFEASGWWVAVQKHMMQLIDDCITACTDEPLARPFFFIDNISLAIQLFHKVLCHMLETASKPVLSHIF